jgi:hypothetical protein
MTTTTTRNRICFVFSIRKCYTISWRDISISLALPFILWGLEIQKMTAQCSLGNPALDYVGLVENTTDSMETCDVVYLYAQVYEPGITPGIGVQGMNIEVEFGYSVAFDENPATWTNWFPATFDPTGGFTNFDQYMYAFTPATDYTHYYTFRFRYTGCDWQYAGYNQITGGGAWNALTHPAGIIHATLPIDMMVVENNSVNFRQLCYYDVITMTILLRDNLTPQTPGPNPSFEVEFGYSLVDNDPSTWTTWVPASFSADIGLEERYSAPFGAPLPNGDYYLTFRARKGTCDWQYIGVNDYVSYFWDGDIYKGLPKIIAEPTQRLGYPQETFFLESKCEQNGWTYYSYDYNYFNFAIEWAPDGTLHPTNAIAKNISQVGSFKETGASASNNSAGTWVMGYGWDVMLGLYDFVEPVNVRFYFDPADKQRIIDSMNNFVANHPNTSPEGLIWFKTVDAQYAPWTIDINPNRVFSGDLMELNGVENDQNGVHYIQFDGISSFSGGSAATGVGRGNPLPLELIRFDADAAASYNKLNWSTASEENTAHFNVERSANGFEFETIGAVNAAGFSDETLHYQFKDNQPLDGTSYYRLQANDLDGTSTYTDIITVSRNNSNIPHITKAFPNPSLNNLFIEYINTENSTVFLEVHDNLGNRVYLEQVSCSAGINLFTIPVEHYLSGLYHLTIRQGQNNEQHYTFSKQ